MNRQELNMNREELKRLWFFEIDWSTSEVRKYNSS
jgi:hypothetical protein